MLTPRKCYRCFRMSLLLLREYWSITLCAAYDTFRYWRWAILGFSRHRPGIASIEALLIKNYHAIEKGLSMQEFRPRFGRGPILAICKLVERYLAVGGDPINRHLQSAICCIAEYQKCHLERQICIDDIVPAALAEHISNLLIRSPAAKASGGVKDICSEELFVSSHNAFTKFAESRVSCRSFDPRLSVDPSTIERAVLTAMRSPSVCNRQAWRVHVYMQRDTIDTILALQNGNRGFGHLIPCLIIVSSDLRYFDGAIERNQAWIDGGIFSMSLMYALHSNRLGTVPLNWCVLPSQDRSVRRCSGIPEYEAIILMIGIGHPNARFFVPISQRRTIDEVLRLHH